MSLVNGTLLMGDKFCHRMLISGDGRKAQLGSIFKGSLNIGAWFQFNGQLCCLSGSSFIALGEPLPDFGHRSR